MKLSDNMKQYLEGFQAKKSDYGLSRAGVYEFTKKSESYYLKIVDTKNPFIHELEKEFMLYKWLENKYRVPKVIYFEKQEDKHYLLMQSLKGINLDEYSTKHSALNVIELYAKTLKELHALDSSDCPIRVRHEDMLLFAKNRLALGKFGTFDEPYENYSPQELFQKLESLTPQKEELVFTHGDYCLDNIMISDGKLQGIIDIGRGGRSDRYKDIALAIRTIRGDFDADYIPYFLEVYGLKNPDWDKIEYYIIMDEFY